MNNVYATIRKIREAEQSPAIRLSGRWLKWPVLVFGIITPASIIMTVGGENMLGALIAYGNCLLAGYACLKFFKGQWLPGIVPTLFLPFTTLSWAFAPLGFAMFFPEHGYRTSTLGAIDSLYRFAFYESLFSVFLLCYLAMIVFFVHHTRTTFRGSRFTTNAKALAYSSSIVVVGLLAFNVASKVANLSGPATYWADGLIKYYKTLLIVAGAFWLRLDRATRYGLIIILLGFGFFYTLGNAREFAAFPLLSIAVGVLFFSEIRSHHKTWFIIVILIALPLYITIGNITRSMGLDAGFENLGKRMQIVTQRSGEYMAQVNPVQATLGRFFVTGGHALVTQTPNVIPHLGFDPIKYAQEMIWTLKPGRQLTMADYGHNFHMLKYGFTISDKTAVGQSMLGHLWMIGGLAGVIMGGLGLGLLHGVLVLAIKRAWEHSMAMALILIAGVAYPLVWARGVNCISHWRFLVWFTAFSFVFYFFYRLVAGPLYRATRPQDTYPGLPSRPPATRTAKRAALVSPAVKRSGLSSIPGVNRDSGGHPRGGQQE